MQRWALILTLLGAVGTAACASSQAVPRPFPGAALPPTVPVTVGVPAPEPAAAEPPSAVPVPPSSPAPAAGLASSPLITAALALRGTPYRNGGIDPRGFDCSGFVRYVFAQVGRQLPRDVQAQFKVGHPVERGDVQPGDLVFFETVSRGASHVGIALGRDEFVHAPSSRGVVRTERYTVDYWAKRWVGARRIG